MELKLEEDLNIVLPDNIKVWEYKFILDDDCVRNSNNIGYGRTWRQQIWFNKQRNEQKAKLVELGKKAAETYSGKTMTRCFCVVDVTNKTNHRFDPPNFELTQKDLMDGIVQGGVLEDDNSRVIVGTLFRDGGEKMRTNYTMTIRLYDLSKEEQ